ncbi:MAG TPA: UDP-N-acetylmuramoyl-L-alanyl-D-glutamate--2,6-diaminopimelate ligase [Terriglobia bacterium]|nr:UDP-N-acetylmuramoyl-L-alanyl-D-glutamate--2,6-diaminopimelate ligase [Terriglobia bacterium]
MLIGELFQNVPTLEPGAAPQLEVQSLAYDSRAVTPGTLFFAMQGEKEDGHAFIPRALESGAVAIVSERPAPEALKSQWVRVAKIRRALAEVSLNFFHQPDLSLQLAGVTGTSGKTTTVHLLHSIFETAGIMAGLFGSIEYRFAGQTRAAKNTTPESLDLLTYFNALREAGGKAVAMEVSSHALDQERVWGFRFKAAVFTNLAGDHLDYHGDFEHYFAAKRRLFEGLGAPPPELGVINLDDAWGAKLLEIPLSRLITYGVESNADYRVKQFTLGAGGIRAMLAAPGGKWEIESPLLGRGNLEDVLAAAATADGLGIPRENIQEGISRLRQIPGRFERIDEGQPFLIFVDYAHKNDALKNVLKTARPLARERVITVFGCGGDRDRTKRPLMGEAAGTLSDLVVLTSDNPRSEDPFSIMNDVMVGLQRAGKPYLAEVDRGTAIRKAVEQARAGDVVVIAGKGHETYQVLKDRTIPFDDREVTRAALRELGWGVSNAIP